MYTLSQLLISWVYDVHIEKRGKKDRIGKAQPSTWGNTPLALMPWGQVEFPPMYVSTYIQQLRTGRISYVYIFVMIYVGIMPNVITPLHAPLSPFSRCLLYNYKGIVPTKLVGLWCWTTWFFFFFFFSSSPAKGPGPRIKPVVISFLTVGKRT